MKFGMEQMEQVVPESSAGYFSLKDDNDSARIRILYETLNDVEGHTVHQVDMPNGFKKYVECLRPDKDAPFDTCPLCAAKNKAFMKMWIPIYNCDESEICMFERGKKFWTNTLYPSFVEHGTPFCSNIFTIIRHGKAGDMQNTTYELVHEGADDTTLDDFDEIPAPPDTLIQATEEQMINYLETGSFDEDEAPDISRRGNNRMSSASDEGVTRRGSSNSTSTAINRRGTTRPNMI